MSRPLVAIVGRPNVGKSMLFNKLCGRRLSIVEDTPGVTRDRLYAECEWCGRTFDIVDTGGIEPSTDNEILLFMREQAQLAIDAADVVLVNSHLSDVPAAIRLSRATLRNIHENLFWAFFYNTIGIPIAAGVFVPLGLTLNPMIGAAGISAFPMSGRVVNKMGLAEDNQNFLLMYSISVNVSGQIASVLAGGLILSLMA